MTVQNRNTSESERQEVGDGITVQDYLNHLFYGLPGTHYFELTFIAPPGVKVNGPHIVTKSYRIGAESPDWEQVHAMNHQGYGVYYSLTPKKQRMPAHRRSNEDNTSCCQALWVDIDLQDGQYPDKDAAYAALCDHIPSCIVDSGGGLHGIWRLEPVEVNATTLPQLKRTLRGLALALKADVHVAELARVFRLPGTINTKPERNGARCEVLSFIPGQFAYDDYFDQYTALAAPIVTVDREFARHKPENEPGYLGWYLDQAFTTGQRNNALNWTAHKMYSDGYNESDGLALLLPKALADGLEENAVRKTIHSAFTGKRSMPSYVGKRDRLRMAAGDAIRRVLGQTDGEK